MYTHFTQVSVIHPMGLRWVALAEEDLAKHKRY